MISSAATAPPPQLEHALRPRSMALNTAWNVIGQFVPLLIAVFTVPLLIKRLGVDRFGVLTLAWALVGYFSLFDLGVGRALTKVVSDHLASGKEREVASAIWTGLAMMVALGMLFGAAIWLSAHWIVSAILRVPQGLSPETTKAMYPLALCIPVITVTTGLRGILEAQHRFGLTNAVRIAMGGFNFLGPLVASVFVASLFPVITVLVIGRVVTGIVYFCLCMHTTPNLKTVFKVNRAHCRELLTTGSWMTVSNVVGPVMVYLDRFLISAVLSVSVVAYYTTPFEVVTKLWMVPVAITSVLFPAFAALFVIDSTKLANAYARGVRSTFALLFPAVFLIVLFAPEGLRLWLGSEFQRNSTTVLRWIAVGVFVNSLAQVPYGLLQAVNRPDLTAKVHLCEVPLYVVAATVAIHLFGLTGAAIVWTLRMTVEALVLFVLARRLVTREAFHPRFAIAITLALIVVMVASIPMDVLTKLVAAVIVLSLFIFLGWRSLLETGERQHLRTWFLRLSMARE